MNIKMHTGRLVAVCTITGLVIGSSLVAGYRSIDRQANELGRDSIALEEADSLEADIGQYLVTADLVLQKDASYLQDGTIRQSNNVRQLVRKLSDAPLAGDKSEDIAFISEQIGRVQNLIDESATFVGDDRQERLAASAATADAIAVPLVERVDSLESADDSLSLNRVNSVSISAAAGGRGRVLGGGGGSGKGRGRLLLHNRHHVTTCISYFGVYWVWFVLSLRSLTKVSPFTMYMYKQAYVTCTCTYM